MAMNSRPNRRHSSAPLSAPTRKRIFVELKKRGIDNDARREIQEGVIGKKSLTKFTERDGQTLIEHLTGRRVAADNAQYRPRSDPNAGPIRRKYRAPDGMIHVFIKPTITQPQIKLAYSVMHRIIEHEIQLEPIGEFIRPPKWTDKPGPRLDGWARDITDGDATRIAELMKEEGVALIELLKAGEQNLQQKIKFWQDAEKAVKAARETKEKA